MNLTHFGIHHPGNAGDTALFVAVRALFFKHFKSVSWLLEDVRAEVTPDVVARINATDAIIIGGGGLFLCDTNKNENSGWQWNCSWDALQDIKKPIIVFAVGYNRFRGQEEFAPVFSEHVAALSDRASFFGLRNTGSIVKLAQYAKSSNWAFQPCPTAVLKYLYPASSRVSKLPATPVKHVAINCAFDRRAYRYGHREHLVMESMRQVFLWLIKNGFRVDIVCHCGDDYRLAVYLENLVSKLHVVRLDGKPASVVIDYYRTVPLAIGMRGHSQLIPFGLGNPIISLISHDKLAFFLNDVGHPEWGMDITNPGLASGIITKIGYVFANYARVIGEIESAQSKLWEITQQNMGRIAAMLPGGGK